MTVTSAKNGGLTKKNYEYLKLLSKYLNNTTGVKHNYKNILIEFLNHTPLNKKKVAKKASKSRTLNNWTKYNHLNHVTKNPNAIRWYNKESQNWFVKRNPSLKKHITRKYGSLSI